MTLRATIEIVPFGNEGNKRKLFTFDISNHGVVQTLPFGYSTYKYNAKVYDENGEKFRTIENIQHIRKDGACELVRKTLERFDEET